jgi:hypothetical protein
MILDISELLVIPLLSISSIRVQILSSGYMYNPLSVNFKIAFCFVSAELFNRGYCLE